MLEFCDNFIIRVPFDKVIAKPGTLEFRDDFVEWGETYLSFPGLNPGAISMYEYVDFWFKDKKEAMLFKMVWG